MKKIILFILLIVLSTISADAFYVQSKWEGACSASEQLTQNLRSGAYNGRYHSYTRGTVTQAHLLQRHLNRLGFSSGIEDGKLGPISTGAIKRMQTYLNTKPDGIVGPLTRAALNNSCGDTYQQEKNIIIENNNYFTFDYKNINYKVDLNGLYSKAKVFHIYGTDKNKIQSVEGVNKDYSDIDSDYQRLQVTEYNIIHNSVGGGRRLRPTLEDTLYYYKTCVDTYRDIVCGDIITFSISDEQAEVRTSSIENITKNSASLEAYVSNKGYKSVLYFIYSEDKRDMKRAIKEDSLSVIAVDYDDVETLFVNNVDSQGYYNKTIYGLDNDEKYYYAACLESNGRFSCGEIKSFETKAENQDFEHPTVQTKNTFLDNLGIRGDAGKLIFEGHVELYDAQNVKTFFVYGTGVNFLPIENAYDSYNEIIVTNDIKKIFHTNVNNSSSAVTFIKSINPTNHELSLSNYILACVEYRDDENDVQLKCGEPRLFDYRDEEYKASLRATDAFAKALVSQGRATAEIHNINTGSYVGAISEIKNENTINGIYKLVYSSQENSYTYYSRLKEPVETIFCVDSTGYVGVMSNRYNPYQFGIKCQS